jgi:hypothetical protein
MLTSASDPKQPFDGTVPARFARSGQFIQADNAPRCGLTQALGAMVSSASTDNPYQAPGAAVVSETIVSPSPRHRFWLACIGWLFAPIAAAALYASRVPQLAIFLALMALWLVSVMWVVRGHKQKGARRSFGRRIVVTVGLTVSLGVSFFLGAFLTTAILASYFSKPIEVRLPRNST